MIGLYLWGFLLALMMFTKATHSLLYGALIACVIFGGVYWGLGIWTKKN